MIMEAVAVLQENGVPSINIDGGGEMDASTDADDTGKVPKRKGKWRNIFKRRSKLELGADITLSASDRDSMIADVSSGKLTAASAFARISEHESTALESHSQGSDKSDRRLYRRRSMNLKKSSRERLDILQRVRDQKITVEEASRLLQKIEDTTKLQTLAEDVSSSEDESAASTSPKPPSSHTAPPPSTAAAKAKPKPAAPRRPAKPTPKARGKAGAGSSGSSGSSGGVEAAFDAIATEAAPLAQVKRVTGQRKRPPNRARLRQQRKQAQNMGSEEAWNRLAGTDAPATATSGEAFGCAFCCLHACFRAQQQQQQHVSSNMLAATC